MNGGQKTFEAEALDVVEFGLDRSSRATGGSCNLTRLLLIGRSRGESSVNRRDTGYHMRRAKDRASTKNAKILGRRWNTESSRSTWCTSGIGDRAADGPAQVMLVVPLSNEEVPRDSVASFTKSMASVTSRPPVRHCFKDLQV